MGFNPDPNKQAQEVLFSRKIQKSSQPSLIFNNIVTLSIAQKHLGMALDTKLGFQKHFKNILSKINKTIGLLWKLHYILPRSPSLIIYESFIRIYQTILTMAIYMIRHITLHFTKKLDSFQYNPALAITGAIRGTSKEKDGTENCVASLRFSAVNVESTCSILFPLL